MKEIKLTQGKVALVDDDMFEYLSRWKWFADKHRYTFYAVRNLPRILGEKRSMMQMHRIIMNVTDKKIKVDHRNRNGLDNCKSNLRLATISENNANRKAAKNSTSKFLGVHFHKCSNKWIASIKKNGKVHYMGIFASEQEAAKVYDAKAKEFHGDFANLNFKINP